MKERLYLFTGVAFLLWSTYSMLSVSTILAEASISASENQPILASITNEGSKEDSENIDAHSVAPIRRALVALKNAEEKKNNEPEILYVKKRKRTPVNIVKPLSIHPAIDKPDIKIEHRLLIDEAIKIMPIKCQNSLRNFYVRYDTKDRGLGGKSTIILNGNIETEELRALFMHEFGHVVDLGCMQGTEEAGMTSFKDGPEIMYANDPSISFYKISWLSSHTQRTGSNREDFVSGYAAWDVFEDFAESFVYYVLHKNEFAKRAQKNAALSAKYEWFQKNLPSIPNVSSGDTEWSGVIPWDITKLQYTWRATQEVARLKP